MSSYKVLLLVRFRLGMLDVIQLVNDRIDLSQLTNRKPGNGLVWLIEDPLLRCREHVGSIGTKGRIFCLVGQSSVRQSVLIDFFVSWFLLCSGKSYKLQLNLVTMVPVIVMKFLNIFNSVDCATCMKAA